MREDVLILLVWLFSAVVFMVAGWGMERPSFVVLSSAELAGSSG